MSWQLLLSLLLAYLIGAIPFGWMIAWQVKHIDIRYHASGRMGMSNVMRVAGTPWGILTAILDIAKGFFAVQQMRWLVPDFQPWMLVLAAFLGVLGHVFSVFAGEIRRDRQFHFRGGAGGLTSLGVSLGLCWQVVLFIIPLSLIFYFALGYASVATALFNFCGAIGFAILASRGIGSWWYVAYSICGFVLVLWSLRPNIRRLFQGKERRSSLRIRWEDIGKKKTE